MFIVKKELAGGGSGQWCWRKTEGEFDCFFPFENLSGLSEVRLGTC